MPTYRLVLAYDGTQYTGWQRQPGGMAVQNHLEDALARVTGESVRTTGSSRTDAGVHAFGQLVSLSLVKAMPADVLRRALNAVLPDDILVRAADVVDDAFDAIRCTRRKRYRYLIRDGHDRGLFDRRFVWHVRRPLEAAAMHAAGAALVGTHDFASFQSVGSERQSTVRTIYELAVYRGDAGLLTARPLGEFSTVGGESFRRSDPVSTHRRKDSPPTAEGSPPTAEDSLPTAHEQGVPLIAIEVEGNGFLYNMVRAIAGTLVEVGRGKRSVEWTAEVLAACDRSRAGPTAPPHGLFLLHVEAESS